MQSFQRGVPLQPLSCLPKLQYKYKHKYKCKGKYKYKYISHSCNPVSKLSHSSLSPGFLSPPLLCLFCSLQLFFHPELENENGLFLSRIQSCEMSNLLHGNQTVPHLIIAGQFKPLWLLFYTNISAKSVTFHNSVNVDWMMVMAKTSQRPSQQLRPSPQPFSLLPQAWCWIINMRPRLPILDQDRQSIVLHVMRWDIVSIRQMYEKTGWPSASSILPPLLISQLFSDVLRRHFFEPFFLQSNDTDPMQLLRSKETSF